MFQDRRYPKSRVWQKSIRIVFLLAVALSLTIASPVCATTTDDDEWTTDVATALASARADGKDLLLLYTGSDWCPPCIRLKEQVLSKTEFIDAVSKKFVLVKFDFPHATELPPELEAQNQQWSERFGVDGFPTIVLIDPNEKPYAITGFNNEGPDEFAQQLNELVNARIKRDEAFEKARGAEGLERAKLIDEGLSALDANIVQVYYNEMLEEIDALDPNDEAGLRTKYFAQRDREMRQAIMSNIAMVARLRQPLEAIEFIDAAIAETRLPLDLWLVALQTKLRLLRKLDRVDDANALVDQMANAVAGETDIRQRLINNKAYYLASLGRTDEAFQLLEEQIRTQPANLLMTIAIGDLHDSLGQSEQAIAAYDRAIVVAAAQPDSVLEVVEAKADVLAGIGKVDDALVTLDRVTEDVGMPAWVRAQGLLHKSLILRETGRRRAAILAENRAVELVETADEKAEIQKLIDQFRRKFGDDGNTESSADQSP